MNLIFIYFNGGYGLGGWGLNPGRGQSFVHDVHTGTGDHLTSCPVGNGTTFWGLKYRGC
jgi:hypothetical protein